MTDATDISEVIAKATDKAVDRKIQSAQRIAAISGIVAIISLLGTIATAMITYTSNVRTTLIESKTDEAIKRIDARVQRGSQAIDRAKQVADYYVELLNRDSEAEGINKRLAFLKLWHLYTEEEDRRLLLLTALQYGDRESFEIMRVLTPELKGYEDLITELTHRKECLEDVRSAAHDCNVNDFAKQLLSKLDPEKALGVLLEAMTQEPLTSPDNANLDIIRLLLVRHPHLKETLAEAHEDKYPQLVGLSFLLYQYDKKEPFRRLLRTDMKRAKRVELVEFLSGWPLNNLDTRDRESLAAFLIPLLKENENSQDQLRIISTIRTIRKFKANMTSSQQSEVGDQLAKFVARDGLKWPLRTEAAEALAIIDTSKLLATLRDLDVKNHTIMGEEFARVISEQRDELSTVYPDTTLPSSTDFTEWQNWIRNVSDG
ncbi:MAG: hypothetical protein AAGA53_04635 [Pseudomonadota bacterium]